MPEENPFPLPITEKIDSWEKLQLLANVPDNYKYTAGEWNIIRQALTYLYENIGGGAGPTPTPSTFRKQFGGGAILITAGANTTPQEICNHINSVGFTVTAGQIIFLELLVKKTISGQGYWYKQVRTFYRNNLVGTWGTGSTNGEIVPADIVCILYDEVFASFSDGEDDVIIELGDIGTTPINEYLEDYAGDDLPVLIDNILADDDSIYYFNCTAGEIFVTYKFIGDLPKTIGVSEFVIGDFQVYASSGGDDIPPVIEYRLEQLIGKSTYHNLTATPILDLSVASFYQSFITTDDNLELNFLDLPIETTGYKRRLEVVLPATKVLTIPQATEIIGTIIADGSFKNQIELDFAHYDTGGSFDLRIVATVNNGGSPDAEGVTIEDTAELYISTNVEDALAEVKTLAHETDAAVTALTSSYSRRKAVINIVDNTAAPPTELSGDRYILDFIGSSHADWDGAAAGSIVEFDGADWNATTPIEGWIAYVDAENKDALYVDDGSPEWQLRSVGAGNEVLQTDYNANTILSANTDNTPLPITIAESQIIGRLGGGNIKGLSVSETKTLLAFKEEEISGTRNDIATASGTVNLDWKATKVTKIAATTGSITFADVNLPTGAATKVYNIWVTKSNAAHSITFPAYYIENPNNDSFSLAGTYEITINCIVGTSSSEIVTCSISKYS